MRSVLVSKARNLAGAFKVSRAKTVKRGPGGATGARDYPGKMRRAVAIGVAGTLKDAPAADRAAHNWRMLEPHRSGCTPLAAPCRAWTFTQSFTRTGMLWVALGAWTFAAQAQSATTPLPRPVAQALARAQVPLDAVSMLVVELDNGKPRLAHRAQEAMNPASVTKLVTTSAALELLGPQHTWTTTVLADGELSGDLLQGRLVIRGGGDPKLVVERLQALVAQVQASGVKHVRGDIVLDRSLFKPPRVSPGDFDGEPLKPYNVQADALLVNFQSLLMRFAPDAAQGRAKVTVEPAVAGMQRGKRDGGGKGRGGIHGPKDGVGMAQSKRRAGSRLGMICTGAGRAERGLGGARPRLDPPLTPVRPPLDPACIDVSRETSARDA